MGLEHKSRMAWLIKMWHRLIAVDVPDEEKARSGRFFNTLMVINAALGIAVGLILVLSLLQGFHHFPFWVAAIFRLS